VKESNWRRTLQSALAEEPAIVVPSEFDRVFRTHHGLVFLRLFRRDPHGDVLENEESYLRRAAINAALDVMRSRQADRTVELSDLPAEPAHDDPRELRQALGRALAQLKPRPAEIFALRFLEGFSNPQIARMLGISQVLVAVIVHRTRQQLRRELGVYLSPRIQETGHEK
jgi:RNA polymerase sigma-70 factor (ECF subfamily)